MLMKLHVGTILFVVGLMLAIGLGVDGIAVVATGAAISAFGLISYKVFPTAEIITEGAVSS